MHLLNELSLLVNSASLASVFFRKDDVPDLNILSSRELEIFSKISSPKRQIEFIAGRRACKRALFKFLNKPTAEIKEEYSEISILYSETGSPLAENLKLNVTISHSHEIAVAAVSNSPIGIDIEQINPKRISALKYANPDSKTQNLTQLTVMWTLKEALSKALKTGLMKDFKFYNTQNFQYLNKVYRCSFQNFPKYHGIAITNNKYAVAIVQLSN